MSRKSVANRVYSHSLCMDHKLVYIYAVPASSFCSTYIYRRLPEMLSLKLVSTQINCIIIHFFINFAISLVFHYSNQTLPIIFQYSQYDDNYKWTELNTLIVRNGRGLKS